MSSSSSPIRLLRRVMGGALLLLVTVPFWRLLSSVDAPIAGEAIRLTDEYSTLLLQGTISVVVIAALAAFFLSSDFVEAPFSKAWSKIESLSGVQYAILLAVVSGVSTALLSWYVWESQPVLVDVLAQLVHARYLAEGLLAAPPGLPYEFWVSTNTFLTDQGWLSQYPPGHVAVLAAGLAVGAVWLVCPLLMAVAVFFTSLVSDRLFPEDKLKARVGALLFALSPYLMTLAAAHMSHVTFVALMSAAAYFALRARDGNQGWAIVAGMAVGCAFAARSLSAMVLGTVLLLGTWLIDVSSRERPAQFVIARAAISFGGALPFLLGVAFYNAHFFGSPFEFGYTAYLGPNHGLGFHTDPFGNSYGPLEGLAYTSSDLTALGHYLFRTPVSALLIVGLFLILAKRLTGGERLVTAWALSLVIPFWAYWHHDLVLGPRMISDAAPGWCLLAAVSGLGLVRAIPKDKVMLSGRFSPRLFVTGALSLALVAGFGYFTPRAVQTYSNTFAPAPSPQRAGYPALVFVHGSWEGRIISRLLGAGMRADSVNLAISINSTCAMHHFANAYRRRHELGPVPDSLTVSFSPGIGDGSARTRLPNGVFVRKRPDEELTEDCLTEANSDRGGAVPLLPLLWQGDLPGLPAADAMYVRDLGPSSNVLLVARYPRRRVGVMFRDPESGRLVGMPYRDAMALLWGDETPEPEGN